MPDLDITTHIKIIESLKCALLSDLALLYDNMRRPVRVEDREEPMAGMLVSLYLLARQLGLDFARLDELAVSRMRRELLSEDGAPDVRALLKYLNNERE